MATIHIREIAEILAARETRDAAASPTEGFFLEIRFDTPTKKPGPVDEELKNKVITADCPMGSVTIQFDENGQLKSLDIS
jgi:hypothetical protein